MQICVRVIDLYKVDKGIGKKRAKPAEKAAASSVKQKYSNTRT